MSDIQFNEDYGTSGNRDPDVNNTGKITQFLINKGVVKDRKSASYFLVGVIVISTILIGVVFSTSNKELTDDSTYYDNPDPSLLP